MRYAIAFSLMVLAGAGTAFAAEVKVGDCVVVDATQLSDDEIQQIMVPIIEGGTHPTSCLQASQAVEFALRNAGAFAARVYPEVSDATPVITLRVIEGRLADDGVKLGSSSARVQDEIILNQTRAILEPGSTLTADKYERAILLLNDLPGIEGSESSLYPSETVGEANFETHPNDANLIEGYIFADNFGSASTGEYRGGGSVTFNSPFRQGEKFTVTGNFSNEATHYLSLDSNFRLSDTGLRGGVDISALEYRTDEADNLRGYSREVSTYLSYPLVRSRQANLYSEVRLGRESMKDKDDSSTVTDRYVETVHLTLSGDRLDDVLGGGKSKFSLEGVAGYLDLSGYEPYRQEDQNTARTNGRFYRLVWSASRLQHIMGPWQAYIEAAGQTASKRLDSSQSISFGGPYDFPGYKSGEVLGDEGARLHVDLRYNVPEPVLGSKLQISTFYNVGEITSHAKSVSGNVISSGISEETYTLQSAGVGFSMSRTSVTLRGVVAQRIDNEVQDSLLDGDTDGGLHGWLQLVHEF